MMMIGSGEDSTFIKVKKGKKIMLNLIDKIKYDVI